MLAVCTIGLFRTIIRSIFLTNQILCMLPVLHGWRDYDTYNKQV